VFKFAWQGIIGGESQLADRFAAEIKTA
jgi:hypothetical protein